MYTLQDALHKGKLLLKEKNIADGDLDAWYLLFHLLCIDRTQYLMYPDKAITDEQYGQYLELIELRGNHMPLQYITGEQEFMGLKFKVTEDVLIPRQDTECLVGEVLKVSEGKDVLDLCTGSGCIIISLAKLGKIRRAVGADISGKALEVARDNAESLEAEVEFIHSDLYQNINRQFDILVSNPPYIPTQDVYGLMKEVKDHEPLIALDGSEDGLFFYRRIIRDMKEYLKPGGFVFFEIGYNQGDAVTQLLEKEGITKVKIIKDLAGLDRIVSARLEKALEPFT